MKNEAKKSNDIFYKDIKKTNIKEYIGCYKKISKIDKVRCKYNRFGKKNIPDGKDENGKIKYKVISNNGKGWDYDVLIEFGKKYMFDLNDPKIKFMVDNLIRGGKIKEVEEVIE